jgi:SNF2 family DNA or RNA helicase
VLASIGLEQAVFGAEPEKRFREVFPQGEALATESVPSLLAPVMLRRTRAEVLPDLPGKTYQDVPVALDGDVRGELDLAARECRELELGELPPFERLSGARRALADAKTPFALEFVGNAAAAGPVVVFSAHTRPIERIGSLPGARAIVGSTPDREREAAIEAFQRGELAILALTIGAGGVGLTLTRSSHVVFVDRAYNPGDNEQAEDRLARIGQENKVLVTRLVSEHAIDRRLNEILDRKQKTIADALGGKRK